MDGFVLFFYLHHKIHERTPRKGFLNEFLESKKSRTESLEKISEFSDKKNKCKKILQDVDTNI